MLPNLLNLLVEPLTTVESAPNEAFFDSSIFELFVASSFVTEPFLQNGIDMLTNATGELTITAGVLDGTLTTAADESLPIAFDTPAALAAVGDWLADASGNVSLIDGFVNATLATEDSLYEVTEFDLATFAADGLSFLVSEVDAAFPIMDGTVLISEDTPWGVVEGAIAFGDGALDVAVESPAGAFDLALPFSPDAQFLFAVPTPFGTVDANVNFFTGNIEIPFLSGFDIEVPLNTLSGELALSDGDAALTFDTVLGQFTAEFELDELVSDAAVDFLTGVTLDAQLLAGQLDVLATSGAEAIATSFDLIDLNNQAVELAEQLDGEFSLGAGILTGTASLGAEVIAIEQSVAELTDLLNTPLSEVFSNLPTLL
jgi:hypothetical protein